MVRAISECGGIPGAASAPTATPGPTPRETPLPGARWSDYGFRVCDTRPTSVLRPDPWPHPTGDRSDRRAGKKAATLRSAGRRDPIHGA
jgi:hypothetical protein